jgi:hypothetical protein
MAGLGETLGSPWPPLAIRPWFQVLGRLLENFLNIREMPGKYHDQAHAEWIVIRGPLRGENDTRFGKQTPSRLIGCPWVGHPMGVFGVFRYY